MEWRMLFMFFLFVAIYAQEGGLDMEEVEGVQLEESQSDALELESEETDNDNKDCVYTDSEGNYCDCNADKTCVVAHVHFEACGDKSTSLQYLVNQCVPTGGNKGKGKFRSFKQKCRNGVVTKQWHHSEDCSDNAARTDFVSNGFKSCVQVVCDDTAVNADEEESPFEAVVEAMESSANYMSSSLSLIIASIIIVLLF